MSTEHDRVLFEVREARERAARASGWVFPDVRVRDLGDAIPWSYETVARGLVLRARCILDLGTGGGERLGAIVEGTDARVVATEEWHVNAPIAQRRLRAIRADVVRCTSLRLPLRDGASDLVLDRHEALEPSEVARVLARGGVVYTQQVGPDHWPELRPLFPAQSRFEDHFHGYQEGFRAHGLVIDEVRWHDGHIAFERLADLVFMLLVAPWEIPGFEPERDIDALAAADAALRTPDGIVLSEAHYVIRAHRPG